MTESDDERLAPHVSSQVASTWAGIEAAARDANLRDALLSRELDLSAALREMGVIREFIAAPESILGNPQTKHGEIAEQVHVGVTRAFDALYGRLPSATFEGVGRLDAVDYRVRGVDIQSKYLNGLRNTLDAVLGHARENPSFVADRGQYHIPRDQFAELEKLRVQGTIDGLSERSAAAIGRKLDALGELSGRAPEELLHPGDASYAEVQRGRVDEALELRERNLVERNEALKQEARAAHGPSWGGVASAAAVGAAAGGGVCLAQALWVKWRGGKNPFKGEFSSEDWRDVGVAAGRGALGGGVAGGALYLVTNSTELAAPFAGALVSALMGIGSLLRQHVAKEIDADEFTELSMIVATDAAVVGLASAAGQVLIPVPALGALIGSIAGKIVASAIKQGLGREALELQTRLSSQGERAREQLDSESREFVERLDAYFGDLKALASAAFDETTNLALRLEASVRFAETVGVPHHQILRTTSDLDAFMSEEG